jgi:pimeloyl-ACP methyl ester carboxylesterase
MNTETLTLTDRRQLGFSQSGLSDGKPLFLFHGSPGSRLFHPPDQTTSRLSVRLITVDRPGYGSSTFQPNRKITDWPKDILQLADQLHLDSFWIAGHSGGGPYVLACAQALPERVNAVALISTAGPIEAVGSGLGMTAVNRLGFNFGKYIPWPFWYLLIRLFFQNRSKDPWKYMDKQAGQRPPADSALMNIPEIRNNCYQSELEAFKNGLRGFAWDVRLLTRPWMIPLGSITVPVKLWHGSEDNMTPVFMARYLGQNINTCTTQLIPGEGHLLIFKYWEEILSDLLPI